MMGEHVPGYDLIGALGEGGQSRVWLGRRIEDGRLAAIKLISCPESVAVSDAEEKKSDGKEFGPGTDKPIPSPVSREGMILRGLHHASIPQLYECRELQGKICLILEYVEGENLREYLEREGPVPDDMLLKFAFHICEIFLYLHGLDPPVIYRDLKPGNLILTGDGRLVLIDFGSARFYRPGARTDTVYLGTRGYAAPELYGGLGQSDIRTDIYAFGMTLYHLRSGQTPPELPEGGLFGAAGEKNLLEKLMKDCTQADPGHRPESFEEIRERLTAISEADGDRSYPLEGHQIKRWREYQEKLSFLFCFSGLLLLCICVVLGFRERPGRELPGLLLVSDQVTGLILCQIEQVLDSGISEKRLLLLLDHIEERLCQLENHQKEEEVQIQNEGAYEGEEVMIAQAIRNLKRSRRVLLAALEKREGIG